MKKPFLLGILLLTLVLFSHSAEAARAPGGPGGGGGGGGGNAPEFGTATAILALASGLGAYATTRFKNRK